MFMGGHDLTASTAENYRAFARDARGRSPEYEHLATEVAGDPGILAFLASLPRAKRQPNLLFAAACYLLGEPPDIASLRALVAGRGGELRTVILARRTQTNEPARCATLVPLLAMLPQPVALMEVGASAGLTLLPDRYSYDYAGHRVDGTDPGAPVIACEPRGPVPLPSRVPEVAWRAGLDLNPLDVTSDDDMRWLDCLIWPGEADRRERLRLAVETARRDPPPIYQGDLLTDVPALARQAPREATLVIFHSAVLAYVDPARREEFARTARGLGARLGRGATWISNEAPGVIADATGTGAAAAAEATVVAAGTAAVAPAAAGTAAAAYPDGCFVLTRDGGGPIALTDGHGTWLHWLPAEC
jgi:hypothetical protein